MGLAGGVVAVGGRRPTMRAQSPGIHACFMFCVLSIVSRVVRAQMVKPAGRIFYVHEHELEPLPRRMPGRPSIVHEPGRPTSAACAVRVLCVCCAVLCCAPRHARPCDASRARVVRLCAQPCTAGACASPYGLTRRLWPYHGLRKCTGMLAPAMRPRPHSVAYRQSARARPAQLGRLRDVCT